MAVSVVLPGRKKPAGVLPGAGWCDRLQENSAAAATDHSAEVARRPRDFQPKTGNGAALDPAGRDVSKIPLVRLLTFN